MLDSSGSERSISSSSSIIDVIELNPLQKYLMVKWAITSAYALLTNGSRDAMPGSSIPWLEMSEFDIRGAIRYEHDKLKSELNKRPLEDAQRREAETLMVNLIDQHGLMSTFDTAMKTDE